MRDLGLICLIPLAEPARLDAAAVREALRRVAPRADVVIEQRPTDEGGGDDDDSGGGLAVSIDRQDFAAVALAGRLPQEVYDGAMQSPVGWRGRAEALAGERAFVAAAAAEPVSGHGLARAQAIALTRLAAALAETLPALAVVWEPSRIAAPPERLARLPELMLQERWPVEIWVGYRLLRASPDDRGSIGARSHGAATYFGSEIEVVPFPTDDPGEPLRIALGIVGHLMAHGSHIRDGQTIRTPKGRRARCSLHPGREGGPGVIRLALEAAPGSDR
jgi:hypothetical protein